MNDVLIAFAQWLDRSTTHSTMKYQIEDELFYTCTKTDMDALVTRFKESDLYRKAQENLPTT
jgi:hypothetical protein